MKKKELENLAKKVQLEIKEADLTHYLKTFNRLEKMLTKFKNVKVGSEKNSIKRMNIGYLTLKDLEELTKNYSSPRISKKVLENNAIVTPDVNKLECIKRAGQAVSNILKRLKKEIKPGVSGNDLDKLARQLMEKEEVKSSTLGYRIGDRVFPSAICVSLNEELTHGIPDKRFFKEGDLVSIDVACSYRGYHADAALTTIVGIENDEAKNNLLKVTKDSLHYVIQQIKPNITTNQDIGRMLTKYIRSRGYFPIQSYGGHGIGEELHQEPFIPNTPHINPERIKVIKDGMFICIEPLVQIGDEKVTEAANS
nr:3139_t:CDS:2 [Entrophospora candida]